MKKKTLTEVDQVTRLLYVLLRYDLDLDQGEFAAATRTASSQVSVYDRGERAVPEDILGRAADRRGFPRVLLQPARRAIRSFRAAARGWSRADRALAETFFAELLALSGEAFEAITAPRHDPHKQTLAFAGPKDQKTTADLWLRLERRSSGQRLAMVEEIEEFRNLALCELVAAQSLEKAPSSPAESLELAELALCIAEGGSGLHQRAQGYCWFHVANSRRVTNDLPGSETALATAKRLWDAGTSGETGLFDETRVYWIEATVRKAQRRFPEALNRIEEALAADRGGLRGKLLLSKAQILGSLGDIETSIEVLREAALYIDEEREPRATLGVRFQHLVYLCLQDRAPEAAADLPRLRALAEKLDQEMDRVRLGWLGGKIAAGTGRTEEAEVAFEKARHKFAAHKPPLVLDYALVNLDLGLLLLEQGRTPEVRGLAEEMAWIFDSQGVQREALAALAMFCEAAKREAATVELTRRVVRFLHRSQCDPELKFEAGEEVEAS